MRSICFPNENTKNSRESVHTDENYNISSRKSERTFLPGGG